MLKRNNIFNWIHKYINRKCFYSFFVFRAHLRYIIQEAPPGVQIKVADMATLAEWPLLCLLQLRSSNAL